MPARTDSSSRSSARQANNQNRNSPSSLDGDHVMRKVYGGGNEGADVVPYGIVGAGTRGRDNRPADHGL
jgi:hypothetical protein